jgi:leader peptidase (prepilin peptidase) / N-methyltransferase
VVYRWPVLVLGVVFTVGFGLGWIVRMAVARLVHGLQDPWPRFPLMEVMAGLVCALLAWRLESRTLLPAFLYLGAVGTVLAVIDARTRVLPEALTLPSYPIGIGLLAVDATLGGSWAEVGHAVLGMIGLAAVYALIWVLRPGFGFGDVVFAGILGLYLGRLGMHAWFIGAWAGGLLAAGYVVFRRLFRDPDQRAEFALGPWMALGALIGVVAGIR